MTVSSCVAHSIAPLMTRLALSVQSFAAGAAEVGRIAGPSRARPVWGPPRRSEVVTDVPAGPRRNAAYCVPRRGRWRDLRRLPLPAGRAALGGLLGRRDAGSQPDG